MKRLLLASSLAAVTVTACSGTDAPLAPHYAVGHTQDWQGTLRQLRAIYATSTTSTSTTTTVAPASVDTIAGGGEESPASRGDGRGSARSASTLTPPPVNHEDESPPAGTGAGNTSGVDIMCESGGDYAASDGSGYYGAYQFDRSTWAEAGGSTATADQASPAEQDAAAAAWVASGHRGAWPNC